MNGLMAGKREYPVFNIKVQMVFINQSNKRFFLFLKDFIFFFLDSGREGEREGNINVWLPLRSPTLGTWSTTQACALHWELNQ